MAFHDTSTIAHLKHGGPQLRTKIGVHKVSNLLCLQLLTEVQMRWQLLATRYP